GRAVRRPRRARLERRRSAAGDGPRCRRGVPRVGVPAPPAAGRDARPPQPRAPRAQSCGANRAITSLAAQEPTAHLALSNTFRPALTGWLKTLSREVGPKGITVNCVAPGRIATPRLDELYPDGPSDAQLEEIALRRWGAPREFGDVVCFLASDRARY